MTLREKLIALRDKAGISQMSLAHQLDVSRQAVSRWESGDTTPSMDKLKALAKIYGVSLDWLCSDVADENHSKQWGHQKTMKQIMPLQVRKIRKGEKFDILQLHWRLA